jgi:hypothetical protein
VFTSRYKTTEIVVPERRYQALVEGWFESLPESEVKSAIRQIRWRELRPQTPWFRLSVLCEHPYPNDVVAFLEAKKQDDVEIIGAAASKVLKQHDDWFRLSPMPLDAIIDDRPVKIDWAPQGITYYDPDTLPPQERAEHDLDRQATSFLWLVHVTAQTDVELVSSTVGKNIPFASAGLLLTGHVKMIRRFPERFPETDDEKDQLQENILEHPADFIILMRLAAHFGCELELVRRVIAQRELFLREQKAHLESWSKEYARYHLEDDFFVSPEELRSETYTTLEKACEGYSKWLIAALVGLEHEIPEILNSFLWNLPIPNTPFKDDLKDDGDWWKFGS